MTESTLQTSPSITPQCMTRWTRWCSSAEGPRWPRSTSKVPFASALSIRQTTTCWGWSGKGSISLTEFSPSDWGLPPFIFNCLAKAIEWAARQEGVMHTHHYLDASLWLVPQDQTSVPTTSTPSPPSAATWESPLAEEKREGPTTCLEYLGILLDSTALEARLPPHKLEGIHQALRRWAARTQCRKQELLSLIGTLSFAFLSVWPMRRQSQAYPVHRRG